MENGRRAFLARSFVAGLAFLPLLGCGASTEAASTPTRHERVAVIGASASAGFGLEAEADREVTLAEVLKACAPDALGEVLDASDLSLFLKPKERLARKIDEVVEFAPDLVVGVDAMFWFAYGPIADGERVERLREGLGMLDDLLARTGATLLLGDVPDVRDASPFMMPPGYRPSDAALAQLQQELHAYCDAHEDVVLVPLAEFTERVRRGESVTLFGTTVPPRPITAWQQNDRLHPTLEGTVAIALIALQQLERTAPLRDAVRSDPVAIAAELRAAR
ncbi:MAG: hypothetical protein R3F34_08985 [Planctomycetota bacterium]